MRSAANAECEGKSKLPPGRGIRRQRSHAAPRTSGFSASPRLGSRELKTQSADAPVLRREQMRQPSPRQRVSSQILVASFSWSYASSGRSRKTTYALEKCQRHKWGAGEDENA